MLEKPDIKDIQIIACLQNDYHLNIDHIEFLPIGADQNTAVYRAVVDPVVSYFVKLRSGEFDAMTLVVPNILHEKGIKNIIAPLSTRSKQVWTDLADYKLAVFPFIDGRDGYDMRLEDHHWVEFGRALRAIHRAIIPPAIFKRIKRENFSANWRDMVKMLIKSMEDRTYPDAVATELATFLLDKQAVINDLLHRADFLAERLKSIDLPYILCHADIHAGNVLIDTDDHFYIIDWDTLILAPVERDLMYVGGCQFLDHRTPAEEIALFYRGYGQIQINPFAIAYYRYERIVEDIAAYCQEILLTDEGGEDRANGAEQLMSQFEPDHVIDIAFNTDPNPNTFYSIS